MGTKRSGAKIEIHLEEGDDHEDEAVGGETTSEHLQHHTIKSGGHFLSLSKNKSVIFSPFLDFRQVGLSFRSFGTGRTSLKFLFSVKVQKQDRRRWCCKTKMIWVHIMPGMVFCCFRMQNNCMKDQFCKIIISIQRPIYDRLSECNFCCCHFCKLV